METAIVHASRNMTLDDAIYYALYAPSLEHLGITLMIIRRLVGHVLNLNLHKIQLPTELNIMSWISIACNNKAIILPPLYNSPDTPMYLNMVQDLASASFNKLYASILCSSYYLPEMCYKAIWDQLVLDSEKYVFLTLLLQDYDDITYRNARDKLKPLFYGNKVDLTSYPFYIRTFKNITISERVNMNIEPLVTPTNINASIDILCTPYKCLDLFEFSDVQLRTLAKDGDVELNPIRTLSENVCGCY